MRLPPAPRRQTSGQEGPPCRPGDPANGEAEKQREPQDSYHADPTSQRGAQRSQATARSAPAKTPRQTSTALPTVQDLQGDHASWRKRVTRSPSSPAAWRGGRGRP